jgi:hypothetical protein
MDLFGALDDLVDGAANVAKDGVGVAKSAVNLDVEGVVDNTVEAAGDAVEGVFNALGSLFD